MTLPTKTRYELWHKPTRDNILTVEERDFDGVSKFWFSVDEIIDVAKRKKITHPACDFVVRKVEFNSCNDVSAEIIYDTTKD